jgi:signal transduction histidine kinase
MGDLTLESHDGAGSRFTLWLPAPAREAVKAATYELGAAN